MTLKEKVLKEFEDWYSELRLWVGARNVSEEPLEALKALPEKAGREDLEALCESFRDKDPTETPDSWIWSAAANQLDCYC